MNLEEAWQRALGQTEIIRSRMPHLLSFEQTNLPYLFLAASIVNPGDTVVRKGEVAVTKPLLLLPPDSPQFEGFEFKEDYEINEETMRTFLLMRGIHLPSLKYSHHTSSIQIYEKSLDRAIKDFELNLEKKEDIHTGLITGPEDSWQFSLLVYCLNSMTRSAPNDIKKLIENYRRKGLG